MNDLVIPRLTVTLSSARVQLRAFDVEQGDMWRSQDDTTSRSPELRYNIKIVLPV